MFFRSFFWYTCQYTFFKCRIFAFCFNIKPAFYTVYPHFCISYRQRQTSFTSIFQPKFHVSRKCLINFTCTFFHLTGYLVHFIKSDKLCIFHKHNPVSPCNNFMYPLLTNKNCNSKVPV